MMVNESNLKTYSVREVNRYLSGLFSEDFVLHNIAVQGEVSNLKYHSSGHVYFTLKDSESQLKAVLFARDRSGLSFRLEDGMKVICSGRLGVYERGGSYQLYVRKVNLDGIGDLYLRFEKSKKELQEMGLFDPLYKKPIPPYAMRIGVVTSGTGAAVRDIIQISKRRNPYVELILFPALVQGDGAVDSIIQGIEVLDSLQLDIIIIGRGGGSIEDLWAFNEEPLAYAVFNAETPIISAVGHETDTVITDFVADLRAPTPSAAAELAVFEYSKFLEDLLSRNEAFKAVIKNRLTRERERLSLNRLKLSRFEPKARLDMDRQRLIELEDDFKKELKEKILKARQRLVAFEDMRHKLELNLEKTRHRLSILAGRLELNSPLQKLSLGYGYLEDSEGHRISSVKDLSPGMRVLTTIKDGRFSSIVDEIEEIKEIKGIVEGKG